MIDLYGMADSIMTSRYEKLSGYTFYINMMEMQFLSWYDNIYIF
jgi:hypothetical protein